MWTLVFAIKYLRLYPSIENLFQWKIINANFRIFFELSDTANRKRCRPAFCGLSRRVEHCCIARIDRATIESIEQIFYQPNEWIHFQHAALCLHFYCVRYPWMFFTPNHTLTPFLENHIFCVVRIQYTRLVHSSIKHSGSSVFFCFAPRKKIKINSNKWTFHRSMSN